MKIKNCLASIGIGLILSSGAYSKVQEADAYKVRKGDSLEKIARSYDVSIEDIKGLNKEIKDINKIYEGQTIRVPINENNKERLESKLKENYHKNNLDSYKTEDFKEDSDELILARMLFGEARNCSRDEKIYIAFSAINRARDGKKYNGESIKESILSPYQYSCFNKNDPNLEKLKNPLKYDEKSFKECLELSKDILSGKYNHLNKGQTHYHTKEISPYWINSNKMKRINEPLNFKHKFYKEL